jgi:hypothetical protein
MSKEEWPNESIIEKFKRRAIKLTAIIIAG